ncbi:DNA internalization-related competence protein ComEC/Rec2 [Desulfococcaceae bacterium HSG8]|nr:DNA internalization-related competence protein ComEC/Rec2 [Desulfococcaceae bacterium HSG8]
MTNRFRSCHTIRLLPMLMLGIISGSFCPGGSILAYLIIFTSLFFYIRNFLQPSFELTDRSLHVLEGNGVSKKIISKLEKLINHEYTTKTECKEAIEEAVGDPSFLHKAMAIEYARKNAILPVACLFFAWGYLSLQPYVSPEFPSDHVIHFTDKHKWLIVGVVDEKPVRQKGRLKFILRVETLGSSYTSVTGKISVTTLQDVQGLSEGDRISFVSRIKSIRNFNNPGGFDYERYMAFKKVWASAYILENYHIDVLEKSPGKGRLEEFRNKISALIDETGPGKHVGVLKALITGDRSEISEPVRKDFSQAGIAHLLAISGLHIDIIWNLTFFFVRWLFFSRLGFFYWKARVRSSAVILSLFPVMMYALFSGMSIPTQRALIMFTILSISFVKEEEYDSLNALALAGILILFIYPYALFSASFQLSFCAIFSIIYGSSQVRHKISMITDDTADHPGNPNSLMAFFRPSEEEKRAARKAVRSGGVEKLFSLFWVSMSAILGTLPFIMLHYNKVTLVGLFSNFIFIPVIGFIVVPLGLLSVFLYPFSIQWALQCISISGFMLANTLQTITPSYFEISCFYVLGWAILNLRNIYMRKVAKLVIGLVIIAGAADVCYWMNQRFWHEDLRVTVIDVGQGGSSLLEIPGGECLLVDGGGFPDRSTFDVGERIVAPLLLKKRIKTIDKIVLSHPDSDHMNGLLHIAGHFNVREIWTNNDISEKINSHEFMKILDENDIRQPGLDEILHARDIKGADIEVLYPPDDFVDHKKEDGWRKKSNNNSLVLRVTLGSLSFLFPGDIEAQAEKELVSMAGDRLKSTVLIAPHHGSKTSSSDEFLDAVSPEYVIISSGWNNRFQLPHQSVLDKYRARGYQIYRTDMQGAISISTDGESLSVSGFRTP